MKIILQCIACVLALAGCMLPAPGVSTAQPSPMSSADNSASAVPEPTRTLPAQGSSPTPLPPAPSPTISPTPAPVLRQLTTGGCCTAPFWSADGTQVLFVDRSGPDRPAGIWGVGLAGGPPALLTERLGIYSPDMSLLAYPQGTLTVIERLQDGASWSLANGARAVQFSPDGAHLAWTGGLAGPPFDTARREIWVSRFDGSQPEALLDVFGGGLLGWHPDGRLLVNGRLSPQDSSAVLWLVALDGTPPVKILDSPRIRSARLSPQGGWLAYQVAFQDDPAENGLWVADLESGERIRQDLFGAYRWRDEGRLLVIPLDLTAVIHRIWEIDVTSKAARQLTDPQVTPFRVAGGDWAVSPDGSQLVFVSDSDHNLWLLGLP